MNEIRVCQKCGNKELICGKFRDVELIPGLPHDYPRFVPDNLKMRFFEIKNPYIYVKQDAYACKECGLVTSSIDPVKLKELTKDKYYDQKKCLKCKCNHVIKGKFHSSVYGDSPQVYQLKFKPYNLRYKFTFFSTYTHIYVEENAYACLTCGNFECYINPLTLDRVISTIGFKK